MGRAQKQLAKKKPGHERLYYSITEVSDMLAVKPHVLRYWEQEFGDVRPVRTPRGVRRYRKDDVEVLKRVKQLLWTEGYTTEGAQKRLRDERKGEAGPRNAAETSRIIDEIEQKLWHIHDILDSKT